MISLPHAHLYLYRGHPRDLSVVWLNPWGNVALRAFSPTSMRYNSPRGRPIYVVCLSRNIPQSHNLKVYFATDRSVNSWIAADRWKNIFPLQYAQSLLWSLINSALRALAGARGCLRILGILLARQEVEACGRGCRSFDSGRNGSIWQISGSTFPLFIEPVRRASVGSWQKVKGKKWAKSK